VASFQVVEEMKIVVAYYEKETGQPANLLGIALSARRNLCIHPEAWKIVYFIFLFLVFFFFYILFMSCILHFWDFKFSSKFVYFS